MSLAIRVVVLINISGSHTSAPKVTNLLFYRYNIDKKFEHKLFYFELSDISNITVVIENIITNMFVSSLKL